MLRSFVTLAIVFVGFIARSAPADDSQYNEVIRPILAEYCFGCHGPDANKREGDLRLDLESTAKPALEPATEPEKSPVFQRITSSDPSERMPPPETGKQLSSEEIEALKQWIASGSHYEGHWAYEPIRAMAPPEVTAENVPSDRPLNDIDRFLLKRLHAKGLTYAPQISRADWIRRATLDLTGLPPTWSDVQAFVNDASPQAYETVINRLLESPQYGERWGRHWLDIARYADTLGGAAIGFTQFPFSYTYRDYVINAFNADVPYDRFLTEQIAADQLELPANHPALAGLGFLTVGMQYRNRHDVIDDQIDVISRGLLGLTVACARCHDHKFDAIPTRDYYSLYAALGSSRAPDQLPMIGQPSGASYEEYQAQLREAQERYENMFREQTEIMRGRLRMQVGMYLREIAKGTPEQDLSAAFLSYRTDDVRPLVLDRWRSYLTKLSDEDPVFGLWRRMARLTPEELTEKDFATRITELREAMVKENGEPIKPAELSGLTSRITKWNVLVLDAVAAKQPKSLLELADAYGEVFANAHQQWLRALQFTADEAKPNGTIVPDEDPQHVDANSPLLRQLRKHLYGPDTPTAVPDKLAGTMLNRTVSDSLGGLGGAIHGLHLSAAGSPPRAMALEEDPKDTPFYVFRRGNPLDRAETVKAGFLSVLSKERSEPFQPGKRRLELAKAITDKANPLTRRVIVNWVWQQHFGQGLVRTPDDFGTRGRTPTHPDLLDYLATKFSDEGWSIKQLHRNIMLSAAYAQAAEENAASRDVDPENELLWRMPRRRLELEAMRDSMLSVSGELDLTMGGRPIDLTASATVPRRSVYGFVNRDIVSNFASTFDGANPNACTAKRPDTTVPQQTLFALNSEFIQDRAAKLAALAEAAEKDPAARIQWLYHRVYARDASDEEVKLAVQFVSGSTANAGSEEGTVASSAAQWNQLAHVLLASNEFVFVD